VPSHEGASSTVPPNAAHHHNAHDHNAHDHGSHHHGPTDVHRMGWVGVFLGLGLHTLIDGVALGASIQAELSHSTAWYFAGLGTFAAISLHKPLDAISITSLMLAGGWSSGARQVVNGLFAALCPLGAALFFMGTMNLADPDSIVGPALAFAAGVFLCIALSDLLPEMEFHSHHRVSLSIALLLGILLAWAIQYLEPAHVH
jgi:zinc and cadmium transporter